MIGGNKLWTFYRKTVTKNAINVSVRTYDADNPLYEDKWCRKVRREPYDRPEVKLTDSSRPLVEDLLLIVPIDLALEEDDVGYEQDSGYYYEIQGVEDVSMMGDTYQCPIVRIPGLTKEAT